MSKTGCIISHEGIEYLCGLIRDINGLDTNLIDDLNIKSNGTFSSVRIDSLLNALKTDCNDYTFSLVSNLSRLELKIVTDESSIVDSNILYLHKPTGQNSYNQYVVIEGNKVLLGTTDINMSDYYTITQADTKFTLKTDFDVLKTGVTTHTSDTNIHITTAERTKWNEVDNKVNKTDIVTSIDNTSTDTQVPSAKSVYDKVESIVIKQISTSSDSDTIENYLRDQKQTWYEKPDNVVGVLTDVQTGQVATNDSKLKKILYYIKGTEPGYKDKTNEKTTTN